MPDDLYNRDIVAWSHEQAERLRRVARGEPVNDVDWDNLIEEVESVGRSQVQAVESLLLQALIHAMKVAAWPEERSVRHWLGEIEAFLVQARRRVTPSMAQALDVAEIHRDALRIARRADVEAKPRPLVEVPPLTLAELLADDLAPEALAARMRKD
jgi:hypothetical protein